MNYSPETLEKFSALRAPQRRAIIAMRSGLGHLESAQAAGISRNTLRRWKAEDDFNEAWQAMELEDSKVQLEGLAKVHQDALEGLGEAVLLARREIANPEGERFQAASFLERVAERLIVGYGLGNGGKVQIAESETTVKIYLPDNRRQGSPEVNSDGPDDVIKSLPSAE